MRRKWEWEKSKLKWLNLAKMLKIQLSRSGRVTDDEERSCIEGERSWGGEGEEYISGGESKVIIVCQCMYCPNAITPTTTYFCLVPCVWHEYRHKGPLLMSAVKQGSICRPKGMMNYKVALTPKHYAKKQPRELGVNAPPRHLGIGWRWIVSWRLRPLYLPVPTR
jgi:hypothetical protein